MFELDTIEIRTMVQPLSMGPCARIEMTIFDAKNMTVAEPLLMKKVTTKESYGKIMPTLCLRKDQAQVLMDDLWNCGIRPAEGAGSAGSLAATNKHLEDMRTLVFKKRDKMENK